MFFTITTTRDSLITSRISFQIKSRISLPFFIQYTNWWLSLTITIGSIIVSEINFRIWRKMLLITIVANKISMLHFHFSLQVLYYFSLQVLYYFILRLPSFLLLFPYILLSNLLKYLFFNQILFSIYFLCWFFQQVGQK